MSIGYACLTMGVENTDFKSCILKNASEEKLMELIEHNLNSLENIIDYNIENQIRLFRISSDLIPFGSSPANKLHWWEIFEPQLTRIGTKLKIGKIRVSMHPGQYTVLNSTEASVVERAIDDLNYHNKVLDGLCTNTESKIVLHVGGVYGNKVEATRRFEENYQLLDAGVKQRLVLENDDKSYHICDVLELSAKLNAPVIFDNLHHQIHSCDKTKKDAYWINECRKTWKEKDGRPKIHYSQQDPLRRPGSHSATIHSAEFMTFYENLETKEIDIMLEVKDKNLSAMKCINLTSGKRQIKALELEWSKYKYAILEHAPSAYNQLRKLLRKKDDYPVNSFYQIIEAALEKEIQVGNAINTAQHIWGYFKENASDQEKRSFSKCVEEYQQGKLQRMKLKRLLWNMAKKYEEHYLLNSYYFILP